MTVPALASVGTPGPSRRRTELGLIILTEISVVFAYALAGLGLHGRLPANLPFFAAGSAALAIVGHVANRYLAADADPVMLPVVLLLNGLGYVFVVRLDPALGSHQALWSALGIGLYVLTLFVVRRSGDLARYRYIVAVLGIGLLVMPLMPLIGQDINGARLWIRLGPMSFQPVEVAKLALAIFFASYLVEKRELLAMPTVRRGNHLLPDLRPFGPLLVAWGLAMLIMAAERDVGFSLLIFMLFVSMLWVATGRAVYLAVGAVLFAVGAVVAAHFLPQVQERISVWLDPWKYANTTGYQIVQAQYAVGSGSVAGTGLGLGHPNSIPIVTSDFIFAAIAEELGLAGATTVMVAFLVLVGSGLRAAAMARSDYGKLLGTGLAAIMGFESFFIMAGVTRVLPLSGLALPFVAYGGSSLLANYVLVAILMRISTERTLRPEPAFDLVT